MSPAAASIFLVRHGEAAASWGQSADPPLSERGREQAVAAAATLLPQLADIRPHLVSSPLLRARETAGPLASVRGVAPEIDPRFREIPAPVPLAERQDWLRRFMTERWVEQPHVVLEWRDALLNGLCSLPGGSVVFTHFLVINAVVGHLQRREETLCFWPANASITVLAQGADGLAVSALGEQMASRVN
jgi:probable phosphoglycerate mutase